MTDMLVKLYDIPNDWDFMKEQAANGVIIHKPLGPEKHFITNWVIENFSKPWGAEVNMAFANWPISCYVAVKNEKMLGFACYDSTALGFFGPTGVGEPYRNKGIGKALFLACMLEMKIKGYGYAIIGGIGPAKFYEKAANATIIEDSGLGIYEHCLKDEGFYDI